MKSVAWAVFAVICVLYAVGAYFGWLTRSQHNGGSWGTGSLAPSIAFALTTLMFPLVGVLIATRRPGNSIAWLLLGIGLCWGLDAVASSTATYGLDMHHGSQQAARVAAAFDNVLWLPAIGLTGTFLILLFPDGHLLSPRWRWVAWLAAVTIVLGSASIVFDPGPMSDSSFPTAVNPLGIEPLAGVLAWSRAIVILLPVAILGSAASLVVRFRRSRGDDRLQMKWLAAAAGLVAVIFGGVEIMSISLEGPLNTVPQWLQVLQDVALLSFCVIPIAIGFAVLRYRLYEIDVIIRRTLVYTVLAAVLIGLYLAGVTVLSAGLQTITGQSGTLAVTISTLAVAAVFQPLRTPHPARRRSPPLPTEIQRRSNAPRSSAARCATRSNSTRSQRACSTSSTSPSNPAPPASGSDPRLHTPLLRVALGGGREVSAEYVHLPRPLESIPIICVPRAELDQRRVRTQIVLSATSHSVASGPIACRHRASRVLGVVSMRILRRSVAKRRPARCGRIEALGSRWQLDVGVLRGRFDRDLEVASVAFHDHLPHSLNLAV